MKESIIKIKAFFIAVDVYMWEKEYCSGHPFQKWLKL